MPRIFPFLICMLCSISCFSQSRKDLINDVNNSEIKLFTKPHFKFHFDKNQNDTLKYYKAAYYYASKFNQFRLLDKRRIIPIDNGENSIELFSVNELKNLYNKIVVNYADKHSNEFPSIRLVFYNGYFKEQLLN